MTQPTKTTTRPEHVQAVKLYDYLSQQSAEGFPISIDSTQLYFDSIDIEIAIEKQGVASEFFQSQSLILQALLANKGQEVKP